MFVRAELKRRLERGDARAAIARALGVSPSTVTRHAQQLGFGSRSRPTQFDWCAIRNYYEAGHSVRQCQARFGFSKGAWDSAKSRGDVRPRRRSERVNPGRTRLAVAALVANGLSLAAIARELGLSRATVSHHARALGIPARVECARRYDWAEVQRYYDEGHSIRECRQRFGMSGKTFTDAVRRGAIVTRPQAVPIADLLVAGPRRNRGHVKTRLLACGIKAARCEACGIDRWLDGPLSLQLHHVNGDGNDNRLENLRLLCPNCHSQTENWGGRNAKRGRRAA
jgi:DNA-binding CsgD family transcriptional regulator